LCAILHRSQSHRWLYFNRAFPEPLRPRKVIVALLDEEAVKKMAQPFQYRESQMKGWAGIFAYYRLRIAAVIRDYGITDRAEAPENSRAIHDQQLTL